MAKISKDQIKLFELVTEELSSVLEDLGSDFSTESEVLDVGAEEVDGDPDNRNWIKKVSKPKEK